MIYSFEKQRVETSFEKVWKCDNFLHLKQINQM